MDTLVLRLMMMYVMMIRKNGVDVTMFLNLR